MSHHLTETDVHGGLRAWAKGMYPTEAAVELLIRTGWARASLPWVLRGEGSAPDRAHWYWVDFETIPGLVGGYSGGEQRLLRIAASIGGATEVRLGDELAGLDRGHLDLVLAAIAHAGGSHEHSVWDYDDQGKPTGFRPAETLHPWPEVAW